MTSKKPFVLGVTGPIGSGKSLVGKILEAQGVPVIDTDHLAHELLNSPNPAYDQVIARFGQNIVTTPGGPIDRKKLGAFVFKYERARLELEAIMHPAIAALQAERVASFSQHDIVAVLVPLLFEAGSEDKYDEIWCLTINREVQMARLELRDKSTREQILQRINAQWAQERKAELSDAVIDNSSTKEDTIAQTIKQLGILRAKLGAAQTPAVTVLPAETTTVTDKPVTPPSSNPVVTAADKPVVTVADKPVVPTPEPAEDGDEPTPTDDGSQTGDGAGNDNNAAKNVFYRGVLANMAQVGSAEALDELGNVATTAHKEADASMSMVVKSGTGQTNPDGTAADTSERELRVDVRMTVRNRPGTPGCGNGCSCGCDNCKNGCACMPDCGCGCKPPAPKPTPTPAPTPTPVPAPGPAPSPTPGPGRDCQPWYRRPVPVIALIALLAFLAFLAYLAVNQSRPVVVIDNPTKVVVIKEPVVVNPPVVVTPPPSGGGDGCIAMGFETLSEPPAFSLPFLQNDVRWATAVWTVHYDDGKGYCRNSLVEGHDCLGRLTVRQYYGPHLAYRGQMTVKYLDDGTAQVNRFDSYNVFQDRDSHRINANEVR